MKARFVSESINFERGRTPKASMGIGVINNLPKIIFEQDRKMPYGINEDEDTDPKNGVIEPRGTIRNIVLSNSRILIVFYRDNIRNIETRKKITKINYAEKLIESAGISNLFKRMYYNHQTSNEVYFTVNDEYKGSLIQNAEREAIFYPDEVLDESVNFERGKEPKDSMSIGAYAGLEKILENPEELRDYLVDIDNALHSAMEIYLPHDKGQQIAKMWWEDSMGIRNWEFKSLIQSIDDDPDDEEFEKLNYEIEKLENQGWNVLHIEDNLDLQEAILYRKGKVNESVGFERTSNPKKGMGLGKYAPQIITVPDWEGEPMNIKVQDNTFKINDYEIRLEFKEEDSYGDGEIEKTADVYVDGQKTDMHLFLLKPSAYEFFVPDKPHIKIDGRWQSDPNPENWSKTRSAYGFPLIDKDDKEKIEEAREKHGSWMAMSGDYDRSDKTPFGAAAKLFMFIY